MPSVHLVVPCYRETKRLKRFLPSLCLEIAKKDNTSLIVVDDGSGNLESDSTHRIVEELRASFPFLMPLKRLSENIGKGGAVYAGWLDHRGSDYVGFVDADGACPATEVVRLISILTSQESNHAPIALFASRVKMLGRRVDRLFTRHLLGRVYATLVSELLDVPIYDSQCGLKIVPRRAYEAVASRLQIKGFAFDVELMVALLDTGCHIEEVPIDWSEVPGGKVKLLRDSWRMARDVLRIRSSRSAWRI